jgi:hypothetical protein
LLPTGDRTLRSENHQLHCKLVNPIKLGAGFGDDDKNQFAKS